MPYIERPRATAATACLKLWWMSHAMQTAVGDGVEKSAYTDATSRAWTVINGSPQQGIPNRRRR